jgi:hypothetical protein
MKKNTARRLQVFQRALVPGQVIIHDEGSLFIGTLNNVSAGGCFVDKLVSLHKGKTVRVVIKSPHFPVPVQARGTIVRIEKDGRWGTAIEFTSISPRFREVIQNCVFESKMETALKVA